MRLSANALPPPSFTSHNDLASIKRLWTQLEYYHDDLRGDDHDTLQSIGRRFAAMMERLQLKPPGYRVMSAIDADGTTVGYGLATLRPGTKQGEIAQLFVVPSARKRGIGQQLMTMMLEWLTNNATRTLPISLHVMGGNDEALAFYKHIGFKIVQTDYTLEKPFPSPNK